MMGHDEKHEMTGKRINPGERASFIRAAALRRGGWWVVLLGCLVALAPAAEPKTIIFFGDSITAGYGLDPDEAFPALIQRKLDESGRSWRVVNAGLSGETTAGGLRRLDWILRQPVDIFVIELGGNDGLRGIAPGASRANLQAMMERIRTKYPNAVLVLAGMQLPTNLGPDYTREFAALYPELAQANHAVLIPFLLEGVGGIPALNQADGIHPTAEGHCMIAETVWKVIKDLL
jgi:acyl-CoA thioesterase I